MIATAPRRRWQGRVVLAISCLCAVVLMMWRRRPLASTAAVRSPGPSVSPSREASLISESAGHGRLPFVPRLPANPSIAQIDLVGDVPLLRTISRSRHRLLLACTTAWLLAVLPLAATSALSGTLLSRPQAIALASTLPRKLTFLRETVGWWSGANVTTPLVADTGVLLILFALLPAFAAVSLAFYAGFGPAVLTLHSEGIHPDLSAARDYEVAVDRYTRKSHNWFGRLASWSLGLSIAVLLVVARRSQSWWADDSHPIAFVAYVIVGTCSCYYLCGVGTVKGWTAIRFCWEFFGDARRLTVSPWHRDGFYGLGALSRQLGVVYVGALLSGLCLFVAYRFGLFGKATWTVACLVSFTLLDYAIFVSVPIVLIARKCRQSRALHLQELDMRLRAIAELMIQDGGETANVQEAGVHSQRLQATLDLYRAYQRMPTVPLSLRQGAIGGVYYAAALAQIVAVFLYTKS